MRWDRLTQRLFPYTQHGAPADIVCVDCGGCGWGPMLEPCVWEKIVPRGQNHRRYFLCQPCMEKRLGRKLVGNDLRDCPMNYLHPLWGKA